MPTLRDETLKLRDRFDDEPVHSDHVCDLALQIFDELQAWHSLDARARELLECAATLHDIGWSQTVNGSGHHKRSAQLIRQERWDNLSSDEVTLVAQVARYHRRSVPKPEHEEFHALSSTTQREVMILGGMLRIADSLDRSHIQKVKKLTAKVTRDALTICVQSEGEWNQERIIFDKKSDMLQIAANREIRSEAF